LSVDAHHPGVLLDRLGPDTAISTPATGAAAGLGPGAPSQQRPQPAPRNRSATGDALDRYVLGEYDRALATLSVIGGFNPPQAEEWIRKSGALTAPQRRIAAATLALEYTASRPGLSPSLIEWARDTIKLAGFRRSRSSGCALPSRSLKAATPGHF
jgi:hypothetical protein